MISYVAFDEKTGEIIRSGIAQDENHARMGGGNVLLGITESVSSSTHYVDVRNQAIIKKPQKPGEHFAWDHASLSWRPDASMVAQAAAWRRNELLAASDWTQLPDVPLATKSAWAAYRQQLRDITDQTGFPLNVIWPDPPSN